VRQRIELTGPNRSIVTLDSLITLVPCLETRPDICAIRKTEYGYRNDFPIPVFCIPSSVWCRALGIQRAEYGYRKFFSDSCIPYSVFRREASLAGLVVLAEEFHPIPFRTRPLKPPAPMVLRPKPRESRSLPVLPRTFRKPRHHNSSESAAVSRSRRFFFSRPLLYRCRRHSGGSRDAQRFLSLRRGAP
jgi:hypothetical protein